MEDVTYGGEKENIIHKSINSEEHPFQSLMIEEFLGNIKMEKRT